MHYRKSLENMKFGSVTFFCVVVYAYTPLLWVVLYGQGHAQKQICGCQAEIEIGIVKSTSPSGQVRLGY